MRYISIGLNWLISIAFAGLAVIYHELWLPVVKESPELTIGGLGALLSSVLFSIDRRVQTKHSDLNLFAESELIKVPNNKSRYSDRMAYVLAEKSELAYVEVERENDNFAQFIDLLKDKSPGSENALSALSKLYKEKLRATGPHGSDIYNEASLEATLSECGFVYQKPYLNSDSVQGFICYHQGSNPYIVVAFRGSEKKIEDWLTNVNAAPMPKSIVSKGKVHRGFYNDFFQVEPTIKESIEKIFKSIGRTDVPILFTGHSLGGAIATIATRELMIDGDGACYTFGSPRVADYHYFEFMKTPVYRIVNSSDLVPRVPPGAWTTLFIKVLVLVRYLTVRFDTLNRMIVVLEGWVNRLKDYRHFGDQRYLTDIKAGEIEKVMLLRNPSYLDVVQWFWRHIMISFGMPIKSHSMSIYRVKLAQVGKDRMNRARVRTSFSHFI